FPQLVLVMIIVVTILDLINQIWIKPRSQDIDKDQEKDSKKSPQRLKVAYMVFLMFVFFAFLILFGLPIGVFGFILFSAWTLGYKHMKVLILSSLAFTGFVYLIFVVIMQSLLPNGIIIELLGG
ncbi:MAG: tripartite tricarboxylate transporter TctB family protein, partial [Desulfobacterales bacterium]|nr:tripartite tricarboxylate transporter TctB family protein [Desulfobacterales bacterium]